MRKFITIVEDAQSSPTYLYHGTSSFKWNSSIKYDGLTPQGGSGFKWLFLTDKISEAEGYADYSVELDSDREDEEDIEDNAPVLLRVRFNALDSSKFGPDDYELDTVVSRKSDPRLARYTSWTQVPWQVSLQTVNQITYAGRIPPNLIELLPFPQ